MNKALVYWNRALLWVVVYLSQSVTFLRSYSITSSHFTTRELIVFVKRLSMMLRSSMPIVSALQMLEAESHTLVSKRITQSLVTDIESGLALSSALQKHPNTFGVFCINMVKVGEASGTLPQSLEYITEELKKKHELHKQIVGALLYPLIIVIATFGITIFLILYIFPKILPIFTSLQVALPLSTQILIGMSNFLTTYWYVLFGITLLLIFLYFQLSKIDTFRYKTNLLFLKIPIFGRLSMYYNLANTLRTLGLLLQHEVRIVEALSIAAKSSDNLVYKKALENAQAGVIKGQLLSLQLRKHPTLFPPLCVQMIRAGETTGNVGTTLEYVSVMYEADMRDATKNLTVILEPILMLTMGLCVGFIAVSIITPIYGITQNLHQ